MTLQIIIGVLLLAGLAYAWYTERTRRREAELERDLATRRTTLDGIQKKLDEGKAAYDDAKKVLDAAPIPADMFEHLGKANPGVKHASLVRDPRSGRIIDSSTGAVVEPTDERFHRPGLDSGPSGKIKTTH